MKNDKIQVDKNNNPYFFKHIFCQYQIQMQKNISQKEKKYKQTQQHGSYKAYYIMGLATVCFVLMQLSYKQLTKYFNPFLTLGLRACFLCILNLILMGSFGVSSEIKDPSIFMMLVKRSLISYIAVAMYISSLKYIPIGIANALHNTAPIMTFFIEIFYYKKTKLHWINLLITVICFTGVILIIQPQFIFGQNSTSSSNSNNFYYLMVLLASILSSFSAIFIHDMSGKVHQLVTLQYGYMFQAFGNCIFYLVFFGNSQEAVQNFHNLTWTEIKNIFFFLILMILFAFGSQYLRTISFYMCYPALVMPFSYLTIIFGLIIDLLVFQSKTYNIFIILGMILAGCGLFSKFLLLRLNQNKLTDKK